MNATDYIEQTLEQLIASHGVARVRADLACLLPVIDVQEVTV